MTVHPRPDERHIRASDVHDLRAMIRAEFPDQELNVEGYPDDRFLNLVREVHPDQVTLVPDTPDQPTSDHGWDFAKDCDHLAPLIKRLKAAGHRVALFADPDANAMAAAAATGTDRVELYTGPYGGLYGDAGAEAHELDRLAAAAAQATHHGLAVNAGHDLTVANLAPLVRRVPKLAEVSIGHALFCDSLSHGMENTVRRYLIACAGRTA